MDDDEERSYIMAMLVITVILGVLTLVVAILVAIFPGGEGDDEPTSPAPSGATTPVDSSRSERTRSPADGVHRRGEHPRHPLGGRDEERAGG